MLVDSPFSVDGAFFRFVGAEIVGVWGFSLGLGLALLLGLCLGWEAMLRFFLNGFEPGEEEMEMGSVSVCGVVFSGVS